MRTLQATLPYLFGETNIVYVSFLFYIFSFIEVYLIYNVVLVSAVQQSDSLIHIYIYIFIYFSIMVYQRILNIVPCAIQWDLVVR